MIRVKTTGYNETIFSKGENDVPNKWVSYSPRSSQVDFIGGRRRSRTKRNNGNDAKNYKPLNRVLVRIGSYAVSGVVAGKAGEYAGEQFDELIDKTKELIEFVKSKRK